MGISLLRSFSTYANTQRSMSERRKEVVKKMQENHELASTYFVQNRSNTKELMRLQGQDQLLTESLGGVLSEQTDPTQLDRILDVGCGTGNWLIETAKTYPSISWLIGVDISYRMVTYARSQAEAHQVSQRVQFYTMDALRLLEFPDETFDLINLRLAGSFLRTWDWAKVISEMLRVVRRGGTIRVGEGALGFESNSQALSTVYETGVKAFYTAGHLFSQEREGLTAHLTEILTQYGCHHVQEKRYALAYQSGTPQGEALFQDITAAIELSVPFIRKWVKVTEDFATVNQQAIADMHSPHFHVTGAFVLAWGIKPERLGTAHFRSMSQQRSSTHAPRSPSFPTNLTPREAEILVLVGQGQSNDQIATHLQIGVRTVHSHLKSLYDKLALSSRTELVRYAIVHTHQ